MEQHPPTWNLIRIEFAGMKWVFDTLCAPSNFAIFVSGQISKHAFRQNVKLVACIGHKPRQSIH